MVTSSAVVGSSAMTRRGSSAMAEAISALRLWDAHRAQQLDRPLAPGHPGAPPVQLQRFGDLVADPAELVEGDHGVLQDEADLAAADSPPGPLRLAG
jgi:hypothetical protein